MYTTQTQLLSLLINLKDPQPSTTNAHHTTNTHNFVFFSHLINRLFFSVEQPESSAIKLPPWATPGTPLIFSVWITRAAGVRGTSSPTTLSSGRGRPLLSPSRSRSAVSSSSCPSWPTWGSQSALLSKLVANWFNVSGNATRVSRY